MTTTSTFAVNFEDDDVQMVQRMEQETKEPSMRDVMLRGIDINDFILPALKVLLSSRLWDAIDVSDCRGNIEAVVSHALANNCTKALNLYGENVQHTFRELGKNYSLNYLRVTTTWVASDLEQSLTRAIQMTESLETLDFRWSSFDGSAIVSLAKGLRMNTSLKNLNFSGCGLGDPQVNCFMNALQDHPTLRSLDLSGNNCMALPIPPRSSLLEKLDLRSQKSARRNRLDISVLVNSIQSNTSSCFKSLILAENSLTDEDAEAVFQALADNTVMEEIDLSRNKISDTGIATIASYLPRLSNVRKLSLWGNPFGDAGAQSLLNGLQQNERVEVLELFRDYSVTPLILHHCWLNRATGGRRILKEQHSNSEEGDTEYLPIALWTHVLDRVVNRLVVSKKRSEAYARQDMIFHLLRDCPALFTPDKQSPFLLTR